eukprot:m.156854 g.156854  ORF g.156854 m.156854 type:complete len:79 (+) comp11726_c1_seq4:2057-2293(+)
MSPSVCTWGDNFFSYALRVSEALKSRPRFGHMFPNTQTHVRRAPATSALRSAANTNSSPLLTLTKTEDGTSAVVNGST